MGGLRAMGETFLSIQAQDFIEDIHQTTSQIKRSFLSIQAQDFIEEQATRRTTNTRQSHS